MNKIIEFFTRSSDDCKLLESILDEIEHESKIVIARINLDNNRDLIKTYNIEQTPTMLFLDNDNFIIKREIGFMDKENILSIFKRE